MVLMIALLPLLASSCPKAQLIPNDGKDTIADINTNSFFNYLQCSEDVDLPLP
jgi:hypothetical protein